MGISRTIFQFMILGNITRRDAVHRDAVQQKAPFAQIRLLDAVAAKQKARFAAVWREAGTYHNIVESESDPLTFSKKNPSRANGRSTYIQPPSLAKIRQRTSEEIGNTQTNKQTNAARIIV